MTEDDIVALGDFCEQMKAHPAFGELTRQFELQVVNHMLQTEPHETKKRESIYASFLGVRDFLGNMDAIIDQRKQILERNQAPLSDDDAQFEDEID